MTKEEKDMSRPNTPTNGSWFMRPARPEKHAAPRHPTDEDVAAIAAMSLEEIKSELARLGAKEIPVPTLSSLSGGRGVSTTYNPTCEEACDRNRGRVVLSGPARPAGRPHLWLRTVLVALAALALTPARVHQDDSTERIGGAATSAPVASTSPGVGTSAVETANDGSDHLVLIDVPGPKANPFKGGRSVASAGNKPSLQRRAVGRRNVEARATAARLVREQGEVIKPGDPSLLRFVLDITPSKDKQEVYVAARTEVKKRTNQ